MARMNYSLNHSRNLGTPGSAPVPGVPGTKKKKRKNKVGVRHGNKVLIKAKFNSTCAICEKAYVIGSLVWYDSTKEAGKKCAHRKCWSPKPVGYSSKASSNVSLHSGGRRSRRVR